MPGILGAGLSFVPGKVYTYQDLKFYAMNGFICMHDETTGEFCTIFRREFITRIRALSDEAKRLSSMNTRSRQGSIAELRNQYQQVVADMVECAQEAGEQGDHTEPEVAAWYMRHRAWKRTSVSVSGAANFQTQRPGALPRGRFTGRTAVADRSMKRPLRQIELGDMTGATEVRRPQNVKKLILPDDVL